MMKSGQRIKSCMHMSANSLTGDCMQICGSCRVITHRGVHRCHDVPCNEEETMQRNLGSCKLGICMSQVATQAVGKTGDKGHMPLTSQSS